MLDRSPRIGSNWLNEEERRAHVDGEQRIEVGDRRLFNRRGPRDAGIGDQDVEAISDDASNVGGELMRTIRRRKIGTYALGATTSFADLFDNSLGLFHPAAEMHEHLSTGSGKGERAGATDTA